MDILYTILIGMSIKFLQVLHFVYNFNSDVLQEHFLNKSMKAYHRGKIKRRRSKADRLRFSSFGDSDYSNPLALSG